MRLLDAIVLALSWGLQGSSRWIALAGVKKFANITRAQTYHGDSTDIGCVRRGKMARIKRCRGIGRSGCWTI